MFDSVREDTHVPLSRLFLSRSQRSFRSEVEELARGAPLQGCSVGFQVLARRAKFFSVYEAPIEGKHAALNKGLRWATNWSAAFASASLRFPALFRLVERSPDFLASVLSHFKR
eukprot:11083021-Alexandrium_andersonii.AAC.1